MEKTILRIPLAFGRGSENVQVDFNSPHDYRCTECGQLISIEKRVKDAGKAFADFVYESCVAGFGDYFIEQYTARVNAWRNK